jgi:serine/threonine-protein kinase
VTEDVEPRATKPKTTPFVEPSNRAPIGLRVQGRYRIVSELGTGDFGTVCVAEDEATGHPVAIRLMPRGLAAAPQAGQAILRMGRSIVEASTAHRGLVRVLEFGEAEPGRLFMVMELLEGRRLSEILTAEKSLSVGAALGLALDLAGPLEILHNMGLVHGGLRPRNVMVLKDGRVKLLDVELTGVRDLRALDGVINAEPPAEYLSPEQINRVSVTEKTDIYAFGVILYEMLAGVPPFRAATRAALLAKHQTETPILLRRRRRAIPTSVEHVVMQALAKRPERRPLMPDLLDPLWAEAHGPTKRWRRTAAIVAGAGLAASIVVLVAWSLFAPRLSALRPVAQPVAPAPALTQPMPSALTRPTLAQPAPPAPPQVAQPTPPQAAPPEVAQPAASKLPQPAPPQIAPLVRPTLAQPAPPQVAPPAPPKLPQPAPPQVAPLVRPTLAQPAPSQVAPPAPPKLPQAASPQLAPPPLAQPALPPSTVRAPVSVSPAPAAAIKEPRTAPAVGAATPAVVTPAAVRAIPPPAPQPAAPPPTPQPVTPSAKVDRPEPPRASPAPKVERSEPPRVQWQSPSGGASERQAPSSNTQADDPGAVIDWLLKGPRR